MVVVLVMVVALAVMPGVCRQGYVCERVVGLEAIGIRNGRGSGNEC